MITFDSFRQTAWLDAVGTPLTDAGVQTFGTTEELQSLINDAPDDFFAPPYTSPYEDWCVEDFDAAKSLDPQSRPDQRAVSEHAYKIAWKWCPHPEFCGLVSDDISTIFALLVITGNNLRPLTAERARWYAAGRVPWGYSGNHPEGHWIVL